MKNTALCRGDLLLWAHIDAGSICTVFTSFPLYFLSNRACLCTSLIDMKFSLYSIHLHHASSVNSNMMMAVMMETFTAESREIWQLKQLLKLTAYFRASILATLLNSTTTMIKEKRNLVGVDWKTLLGTSPYFYFNQTFFVHLLNKSWKMTGWRWCSGMQKTAKYANAWPVQASYLPGEIDCVLCSALLSVHQTYQGRLIVYCVLSSLVFTRPTRGDWLCVLPCLVFTRPTRGDWLCVLPCLVFTRPTRGDWLCVLPCLVFAWPTRGDWLGTVFCLV